MEGARPNSNQNLNFKFDFEESSQAILARVRSSAGRSQAPRAQRDDGAATKLQLLEAAGEVFAEKGFERATGKEICERARASSAAVNYHYGGMEALYAEVLVEAHRRLVAYDDLAAVASGDADPKHKLRQVLELMVRAIASPDMSSWALRVLGRELLNPTATFRQLWARELLPKRRLIREIIGGILGLPHDHPAVARCAMSIMSPFVVLLIGDREMVELTCPGMRSDVDATVDHLFRFAIGGLEAVGAARSERALAKARRRRR